MKNLQTKWAGCAYHYLESCGSTNEECFRLMDQGASHGVLVVAGQQSAGKGRRGREWSSPLGESVYMSIGLRPEFSHSHAPMLTLVMALSVCRAIEDVWPDAGKEQTPMIKWPNDIVVGGRKVCGILTEMHLEKERGAQVVIGVGVNIGRKEFEPEIKDTATALCSMEDSHMGREKLIEKMLKYFECYYEKFVEKCDMSTMMEEYGEKMINKDREVRVLDPKGEFNGTAVGINEKGELLVRKEDGTVEAVYAGEVSVRGIYGYV